MAETPIPEYRVRITAALYEALAAYAKANHYSSVRSVLEDAGRELLRPRVFSDAIPSNFYIKGQTIAESREELLAGE